MRQTGTHKPTTAAGEIATAFVPLPLPPTAPPLEMSQLTQKVHAAEQALAQLEIASEMVPSLDWFIYAFVRKEAVLSSQIEGTQATLVDLLTYEATEKEPDEDVEDVCNYLDALSFARENLADPKGLPMSLRLLNETHKILMRGVRGSDKMPGEVRRTQNWVGGTRPTMAAYVPPPPEELKRLLSEFEHFIHAPSDLPPIVRAGLLHVQFESIHPYLDGNGRLGRLLVSLILEDWGLLTKPVLYLSLFFKQHRNEYYHRLTAVRENGDWEGWTAYFLEGVATIGNEAVATATDLFRMMSEDRMQVMKQTNATMVTLRLFEALPRHPIVTMPWVVAHLDTTKPTASRAIETLEKCGILVETTGRKRERRYRYDAYIERLRKGTELE